MTATARQPIWLTEYADPRKLKEKQVEAMCINLYRSVGVWVVKFSQPHKASQTLGIPDLLCYGRSPLQKFWHEVKRYGAQPTAHQRDFHSRLAEHGEPVVVGGLNSAIDALDRLDIAHFEPREGHW